MSNIYIQEPPTSGKVIMKTSIGDLELELWTKEAPKACRNFIQLCLEGYYDYTIFHRLVKGFIVQGGDPKGSGEGGESIYGHVFKDEFHTRLRFCRRGLLAMANAGKDDNGSQFFFTLGATPELQNKHTIFGKVTGETIYNMLKLEDALVDENDKPLYPQKIINTEVITNPFKDIEPRNIVKIDAEDLRIAKEKKANKNQPGVKNFKLLSFGEEAEEDEEESSVVNKQYSGKSKSAHDNLADPKLSSVPAIEPPSSSRDRGDSEMESENDEETQKRANSAEMAMNDEYRVIKERIKSKLNVKKSKRNEENIEVNKSMKNEDEAEEYYLGKDRIDERKKKAEAIRKEIRDLKRGVQNENKAKVTIEIEKAEAQVKKETKSELIREYMDTQEKYKEAKSKVPKKGSSRENFTLSLLKKFRGKLANAKEHAATEDTNANSPSNDESRVKRKNLDDALGPETDNDDDDSWITHALHCEDKAAVLAKDASTKNDDWFEIYDPRNPLNKRRRGEKNTTESRHK